MAISLKNHEDRIKKLELVGSGNLTIELLWSGPETWTGYRTITLSEPITSFDFICFVVLDSACAPGHHRTYNLVPSKVIKPSGYAAIANPVSGTGNSGISFEWIDNRTIEEKYSQPSWDGFVEIYGLKLYYSFSYNNIYKILLRKISRLCQKFTLLKQKECEIIWL